MTPVKNYKNSLRFNKDMLKNSRLFFWTRCSPK